nr:MarR family transcriptional regulator [Lysinibacillus timonensis]
MKSSKFIELLNSSSKLDSEPVKNFFSLTQLNHLITNEITSKLTEFDLSQGKLRILLVLYLYHDSLKPSDIAEYAGVTRSTMTGLLDGLEKSDYIKRGNHSDRRASSISLTSKGKELMDYLIPSYVSLVNRYMSELTSEEHEHLGRILKKIKKAINEARDE